MFRIDAPDANDWRDGANLAYLDLSRSGGDMLWIAETEQMLSRLLLDLEEPLWNV